MGDTLAAVVGKYATFAHGFGQFGELACGLGGDGGSRLFGAQFFRVGEDPAEDLLRVAVDKVF